MTTETRQIDYHYFDINDCSVGRTEFQRGDFHSYDGTIRTTSEKWWIERNGHRSRTSPAKIEKLIVESAPSNAVGLAEFFAQSRRFGSVISPNYTQIVDFKASFGREPRTIFPRLNNRTLEFVVRKAVPDRTPALIEFRDIKIDLDTMQDETHCFWSGTSWDLTLSLPPEQGT